MRRHRDLVSRVTGAFVLTTVLSTFLFIFGCRESPSNSPTDSVIPIAGTYVGTGLPEGSMTNIRLSIQSVEGDTTARLTGTVQYSSETTPLDQVIADAAEDTLFIVYRRASTVHNAWAAVTVSGLDVQYTSPGGIAPFHVNRADGLYNMSGQWMGAMSSEWTENEQTASLIMDQPGQLFHGTIDVTLQETVRMELNSGVESNGAFQLSGIMRFGQNAPAALFVGNYTGVDTIGGFWQAGTNGDVDHGQFIFRRSFQ